MNKYLCILTSLVLWPLSLYAQIDFEGMLRGQSIVISEQRSTEFQNLEVIRQWHPYLKVSGDDEAGLMHWQFLDFQPHGQGVPERNVVKPGYQNNRADLSGRAVPGGPVFEHQFSSRWDPVPEIRKPKYFKAKGSLVLLPNSRIPHGRWYLSIQLLYNIVPGGNPESRGGGAPLVNLEVQCRSDKRRPRGVSYRDRLRESTFFAFSHSGGDWMAKELSLITRDPEAVSRCKDYVDREGNRSYAIWVGFSVINWRKFQFNGIRVLMTEVLDN